MKPQAIRALQRACIALALVVASCSDEPTTLSDPSLVGTHMCSAPSMAVQ